MAVQGESLKRFLPFYKFNSLVASSNPYNWLQTEKFLPLIQEGVALDRKIWLKNLPFFSFFVILFSADL
jgi:hypothetical protein